MCGEHTPTHHTHTHHTRTHMHSHARTPARPHARTPARPHARTPARPHARTPARPHARTHMHKRRITALRHTKIKTRSVRKSVEFLSLDHCATFSPQPQFDISFSLRHALVNREVNRCHGPERRCSPERRRLAVHVKGWRFMSKFSGSRQRLALRYATYVTLSPRQQCYIINHFCAAATTYFSTPYVAHYRHVTSNTFS